jgi:pantoate--beta-alanine ligase
MGYLHEGHLSLARRARQECACVIATIFVNPTQFGPGEDLASYPRDIPRDLELLQKEGVDLVWAPGVEDMYKPDFQTWITVNELSQPLEGSKRPGHFRGVTTVVAKLFSAVDPQKAYFGQKDAQQAVVIRRMAGDLDFDIEIVVCPTVREPDGLAMSSRNTYLDPNQRRAAAVLYRALGIARDVYQNGERNPDVLRGLMSAELAKEPLARPQYVSCAHTDTLLEHFRQVEGGALLSLAVYFGKTRLIDNILLEE